MLLHYERLMDSHLCCPITQEVRSCPAAQLQPAQAGARSPGSGRTREACWARAGSLWQLLLAQRLPDPAPPPRQVFKDPVCAADGHTYERSAIEQWLRTHDTSPMTCAAMPLCAADAPGLGQLLALPLLRLRRCCCCCCCCTPAPGQLACCTPAADLPSLPSPPPNTPCSNEPLEHKLLYPNNLAKALVSEVA